jgi:hypothetical protein
MCHSVELDAIYTHIQLEMILNNIQYYPISSNQYPNQHLSPWDGNRYINHEATKRSCNLTETGWWLTYPSEKYEFVSWGYYSQYMESQKSHVPNISKPPTRYSPTIPMI